MTVRNPILSLAFALLLASGHAFATARFNPETGARLHRVRLAAGQQHTCAILDDGSVDCWGRNSFGQLGDGTATVRTTPVPVSGLGGSAISIAAGSFHTCAILSSGTVRCWGINDSGELGNGTKTSSPVPVTVSGLVNIVSLAAGLTHTCAVRVDGSVWCWGGAPATGSAASSVVPVRVGISGAVSVTTGANHTCALLAGGTVKCWGQNASGQLGDQNNDPSTAPVDVIYKRGAGTKILNNVVEVAAGSSFTCAQIADGTVDCWGDDTFDQLADGKTGNTRSYAALAPFLPAGLALAMGGAHSCVILADGQVQCFGDDDALQLGHPAVTGIFTVSGIIDAVEVAAGAKHTCARLLDGTIHCWGDNTYGQHGDGEGIPTAEGLDAVLGIGGTFLGRGVSTGDQLSCGRRGLDALVCWGAGDRGQLGDAANVPSPDPVAVSGLAHATTVSAGGAHACALSKSLATCWGDNAFGQLGQPAITLSSNQPLTVPDSATFVALSAGPARTCGVTLGGGIQCWGEQAGATRYGAYPVANDTPATAIASGGEFTCLLIADGTVSCWGDNTHHQLGSGTSSLYAPIPVPGLSNVVGIAAGADHACAVTAFGSVICWGGNSRGQIGNGTSGVPSAPVMVPGLVDAVSVSAGAFYTCAARANGTASCWGANDAGELGAKDSIDHLTPTPVAASVFLLPTGGTTFIALTNVVAIATGTSQFSPTHEQTCALLATGVIRCWGDNVQGEIGNGTTIGQPRPTAVNSFAANVDPSAILPNRHTAIVTALIDCDAGDEAHIFVTVEQNGVTGSGHDSARCEGRLVRVPMRVVVHGRADLQPGAATAHLEAVVHRGRDVVDDTHWSRTLALAGETEKK